MLSKNLVRMRSQASPVPTLFNLSSTKSERLLSATSSNASETLKTENTKSLKRDKLLVLGGNGFVGSHICKEALKHGFAVSSLSRSGKSSWRDSWADSVTWHQGDLLQPDSLKNALQGVTSVISCVGGFGSNSHMYRINGITNINAIKAAAEQGAKRFVYISAADFGLVNYVLRGYYEGKRATEAEITDKFPSRGTILRPGFIHGTRRVGSNIKLPLSVIGAPLEMILKYAKPLTKIPLIGPLFIPPVHVTSVAKVALRAATEPTFPTGVIDVFGILQRTEENPA